MLWPLAPIHPLWHVSCWHELYLIILQGKTTLGDVSQMLQQPLAHFPRASSMWMLHSWLISQDKHTKKLNKLIVWALHGAFCLYFKQDRICTALHLRVKHSVHYFPDGFTLFTNRVILILRKQDPILYNTLFFHFPSLLAVSFCGDLLCNYKHSSAKETFQSAPFFCPCFFCLLFLPRSIFVEESPDWPNWMINTCFCYFSPRT